MKNRSAGKAGKPLAVRLGGAHISVGMPRSPRKMGISGGAAHQPSVYVGFRPACRQMPD